MPTECPMQIEMAVVAMNSRSASHVNVNGPAISAINVSDPVHTDFAGDHTTFPFMASQQSSEFIRWVEIAVIGALLSLDVVY